MSGVGDIDPVRFRNNVVALALAAASSWGLSGNGQANPNSGGKRKATTAAQAART